VLHLSGLVAAARQRNWTRLPEMQKYFANPAGDEVYAALLSCLLAFCPTNENGQLSSKPSIINRH